MLRHHFTGPFFLPGIEASLDSLTTSSKPILMMLSY